MQAGELAARPSGAKRCRASGSLGVMAPLSLLQAARTARGNLRLVLRNTAQGSVVVVVFRDGEARMVFSPGDRRSVGELLLAAGLLDRATVDRLVRERMGASPSLQRFLVEKTSLRFVDVQRFLDFQARQRLLDALAWEEGYFQIEEYHEGEELDFTLALPSFESLAVRATARREQLPSLLAALPAAPAQTLVRRRRGAARPLDAWEREVFAALDQPLLVPQLVARLLVDDDLVLGALLRLASRRQVVVRPVVALAANAGATASYETATLLRDAVATLRPHQAGTAGDLWVLLVSARLETAPRLLAAMTTDHDEAEGWDEDDYPSGLAHGVMRLRDGGRLCLVAAQPDALSRGALEGMLGRCDAVALVREGKGGEETRRLTMLRDTVLAAARTWRPLFLGVDVGAGFRPWEEFPDAVIGVRDLADLSPSRLVECLVGGVLAAAKGRGQVGS